MPIRNEFRPVEKWHKNRTYTGKGDVQNLPVTEYEDTLNSIWQLDSAWERIKFLFHGQVTLRVRGAQVPTIIVAGDIFGRQH